MGFGRSRKVLLEKLLKVMARRNISEIEARGAAANPVPSPEILAPFPRGLTLARASEYSGLTVWMLRTLIWNGELFAGKYGGQRYVIMRRDLDRFLTRKRAEALRRRRRVK
jgi:hypothetical protein